MVATQAARRRTFAIISHPDAGKTTLTEKLLLYSDQIGAAGSVGARGDRAATTSDWMDIERRRGISVTSTVLRFEYRDTVVNLLDTPGHKDFSEDTLRVLAAADCAVMLLDAAKGVEAQTLRLFEVARARNIPLITFVNKYDRPGMDPLEMLDHIESVLGLTPVAASWPVGIPGDFRGVVDRATGSFHQFTRTARGAARAPEQILSAAAARDREGDAWSVAAEELELLDGAGADARRRAVRRRSRDAGATSARPSRTSGSACCSTRCWSSRPRRRGARRSAGSSARSTRRSRGSSSRSRRTWTRATATASRSCASAPGISSAGCARPSSAPTAPSC